MPFGTNWFSDLATTPNRHRAIASENDIPAQAMKDGRPLGLGGGSNVPVYSPIAGASEQNLHSQLYISRGGHRAIPEAK